MPGTTRGGHVQDLGIVTEVVGHAQVVTVTGEVDLHTAPALRAALEPAVAAASADRQDVVVDLTGVSFLDSTGLGEIVGAHKALQAGPGHLHLVTGNDRVRRLVAITGLDGALAVHPDRAAAWSALGLTS
jgi:anti-sigma B factor antagonist